MPASTKTRTLGELVPEGHVSKLPPWALRLTERQLRFVQEYMVDRNGRRAALRARISASDSGAASVASGLLRDPAIREALDELWAAEVAQRLALRDRIMEELSAIAFLDIGDLVSVRGNAVHIADFDGLTDDQRRAVKRVKQTSGEKSASIEIEMHDKIRALDLLDQMNGAPRTPKGGGGGDGGRIGIKDSVVQVNITPEEAKAV